MACCERDAHADFLRRSRTCLGQFTLWSFPLFRRGNSPRRFLHLLLRVRWYPLLPLPHLPWLYQMCIEPFCQFRMWFCNSNGNPTMTIYTSFRVALDNAMYVCDMENLGAVQLAGLITVIYVRTWFVSNIWNICMRAFDQFSKTELMHMLFKVVFERFWFIYRFGDEIDL